MLFEGLAALWNLVVVVRKSRISVAAVVTVVAQTEVHSQFKEIIRVGIIHYCYLTTADKGC